METEWKIPKPKTQTYCDCMSKDDIFAGLKIFWLIFEFITIIFCLLAYISLKTYNYNEIESCHSILLGPTQSPTLSPTILNSTNITTTMIEDNRPEYITQGWYLGYYYMSIGNMILSFVSLLFGIILWCLCSHKTMIRYHKIKYILASVFVVLLSFIDMIVMILLGSGLFHKTGYGFKNPCNILYKNAVFKTRIISTTIFYFLLMLRVLLLIVAGGGTIASV